MTINTSTTKGLHDFTGHSLFSELAFGQVEPTLTSASEEIVSHPQGTQSLALLAPQDPP